MLAALPARYAKAIAALYLAASTYLTAYGLTWHLNGALLAIGGLLGVTFIPNAGSAAGSPAAIPPQRTAPPPGQAPTAGSTPGP
jgi:hypothetical protein